MSYGSASWCFPPTLMSVGCRSSQSPSLRALGRVPIGERGQDLSQLLYIRMTILGTYIFGRLCCCYTGRPCVAVVAARLWPTVRGGLRYPD